MDDFSKRIRNSIERYKTEENLDYATLGNLLSLSLASVTSKMNGSRRWTLRDLRKLAALGVDLPPLSGKDDA
ncbi:helix-turn-helix domain-containing protein [Arcanobacterium hippocoleae]